MVFHSVIRLQCKVTAFQPKADHPRNARMYVTFVCPFCSRELDFDLDSLKMYLHIRNELCRTKLSRS